MTSTRPVRAGRGMRAVGGAGAGRGAAAAALAVVGPALVLVMVLAALVGAHEPAALGVDLAWAVAGLAVLAKGLAMRRRRPS